MPKKNDLIEKISRKPIPKNFTKRELDILMNKCNCTKFSGGEGDQGSGMSIMKQIVYYNLMNLIRELNYMVTRLRRQYSF